MPPSGGQRTSLGELVTVISRYQQNVTFGQSGVFSPGTPIQPTSKEPVRIFDFRVGENTFWTPRGSEPWSFAQLRNLVEPGGFDIARLAIETRKDQVERLDWAVRPTEKRKPTSGDEDRIKKVRALILRPDGIRDFATWTRRQLEDLFVIDAPAVEVRRNRGGEIIALDVVDGATFKLLVDDTGRTPLPPAPAYEQIIKGRPWALLSTDDLIYRPRNQRPNKLYGFSPVEQILTTIHIGLSRQLSQLNYFTDGTIPAGFINAPEGWTVDQIKELYDWLVSIMSGNLAARRQAIPLPAGSNYKSAKDAPLKDEFDEWVARVVCYAFSLPPTPFVRQLNRSSAESSDKSALEEGLEPIKGWIKRFWDFVIQARLGHADLEFAWSDDKPIDPEAQATIDNLMVRNATASINEVRERHGFDPIPNGHRHLIYTAKGAVTLEAVIAGAGVDDGDKAGNGDGTPDPAAAAAEAEVNEDGAGKDPTANAVRRDAQQIEEPDAE
jgi:Phage portal protein